MHDLVANPLVGLLEGRLHEAVAEGADMPELAAIAVDTVLSECVGLLEEHAASLTAGMGRLQPHSLAWIYERALRDGCLDAVERLLSAQFGGYAPARTRGAGLTA
jgi:hypothetical protein